MQPGRLQGQDASGLQLVRLAEQAHLLLCTGKVPGDLHAPPTFRATARTSATRPDHILVSFLLEQCLGSITVSSDLRGSDHYRITTSLSLTGISATVSGVSSQGVPLRQVHWKGGRRLDYVSQLELSAPTLYLY